MAAHQSRPWDSPGKNTGVGCHFLLQSMKVKSESEISQLCPTLSDLMDCSLPGYSVQLSNPLSFSFSSCFQSFPASGSFLMSHFFAPGGQSIGASASVLPMNIQGWFPLGLTGLISLQSKGLSRVFSNNTVQKHQFFGTQFSLWSNSHIHHDHWKNHSFDQMDLCRQSNISVF